MLRWKTDTNNRNSWKFVKTKFFFRCHIRQAAKNVSDVSHSLLEKNLVFQKNPNILTSTLFPSLILNNWQLPFGSSYAKKDWLGIVLGLVFWTDLTIFVWCLCGPRLVWKNFVKLKMIRLCFGVLANTYYVSLQKDNCFLVVVGNNTIIKSPTLKLVF